MEAHPPAWEDMPWMWERPEPSLPPVLNRELAWAWAMDNFPALCRPSGAPRREAMEVHPPAREDRPAMWEHPAPSVPPGLNREQALAWAMDNFPALWRPTGAPNLALREYTCGANGLLRSAGTWQDVPGAERGQNRWGDPRVQYLKAESAMEAQPRQGDASARSEAHTRAPGATLSPSPPRKRLKTHA